MTIYEAAVIVLYLLVEQRKQKFLCIQLLFLINFAENKISLDNYLESLNQADKGNKK